MGVIFARVYDLQTRRRTRKFGFRIGSVFRQRFRRLRKQLGMQSPDSLFAGQTKQSDTSDDVLVVWGGFGCFGRTAWRGKDANRGARDSAQFLQDLNTERCVPDTPHVLPDDVVRPGDK